MKRCNWPSLVAIGGLGLTAFVGVGKAAASCRTPNGALPNMEYTNGITEIKGQRGLVR